jgi:hypothetical protein
MKQYEATFVCDALFVAGLVASAAHAAATAEQACQAERAKAVGAYALCQQQTQAKLQTAPDYDLLAGVSQCRVKCTRTWAKLQKKGTLAGSSCTAARFVDDGDATVTDNLTGLQWEKKTNLDGSRIFVDPHDADNLYTWCVDGNSDLFCDNAKAPDGTTFTDFVRSLNRGGCRGRREGACECLDPVLVISVLPKHGRDVDSV